MVCSECGAGFSVEPEEFEWLRSKNLDIPQLCPRCKAFQDGLQDESVSCSDCGRTFVMPRELTYYLSIFNWRRPSRCLGSCKNRSQERTDEEKKVFDFLRRLRAARKAGPSGGTRGMVEPMERFTPPKISDSERFGSLADALKNFQSKKRDSRPRF